MRRPYAPSMRLFLVAVVLATACTPGAFDARVGGASQAIAGRTVVVDVNLTSDPSGATPGGTGAGYAPVVATLAVGDAVRFRNSDGFAHTATSIAASAFPATYPFTAAALQSTGGTLSGGFSSGSLAAGSSSPSFVADRTGTYLYGCFYHYGSPMRAAIVVR